MCVRQELVQSPEWLRWSVSRHQQSLSYGVCREDRVTNPLHSFQVLKSLILLSYQDLAIQARDYWLAWDKAVTESDGSNLPEGLTPEDKLFYVCGQYFLAEGPELRDYYVESLTTMEKTAPEVRKMQFIKVKLYNEDINYYVIADHKI